MNLTVLLPTHNPRADLLGRTLAALQTQTLPRSAWELIVIDNRSTPPLSADLVAWHPSGRVVVEAQLGLTPARFRGIREAKGEVLVWVDDDNLLASDYLATALAAFEADPTLGALGGRSLPEYETPPPPWYRPDLAPLGCRDLGDTPRSARWLPDTPRTYPAAAPIGAGLAIRRQAIATWSEAAQNDPIRSQFGRTGSALTSGEDNDINLSLLAAGWSLAYLPSLRLTHVIPARRLTLDYQRRIAYATSRDFIRVLALHGLHPWPPIAPWTARWRKAKAWLARRAWRDPAASIRWHGDRGHFDARGGIR